MKLSLRSSFVSLLLLSAFSSKVPTAWAAGCASCEAKLNIPQPLVVVTVDNELQSPPPASLFTSTVSGYLDPSFNFFPVPAGSDVIQGASYPAWCVDTPGKPIDASVYPGHIVGPQSTLDPAFIAATPMARWNMVNYVLNHKNGAGFHDIQYALWILSGQLATDIPATFPRTLVSSNLIADAIANGAGFVPGPGQVMGVVNMETYSPISQNTMMEIPVPQCGTIGDFVWVDTNKDGVQNDGNTGMNGVNVSLLNSLGVTIATTMTANAPDGYTAVSGLPPNAPGYYQFTGLCAGTYRVVINDLEPALNGYTRTLHAAGSPATDSNWNTDDVVLPTDRTIDETIDVGYTIPSLLASCAPAATGTFGAAYASQIQVSGGTSPYTFTLSGALPSGLTLDTTSGLISGTPTATGTSSYSVLVTDSTGFTHLTATTAGCNINVGAPPPLHAVCASINSGTVGVAFDSGPINVTGGVGPYTYAISGTMPAGLQLNLSTGAITGTPTSAGSFSVTVTDSTGATNTSPCGIVIAPPTMTAVCAPATTATVGVAYSSAIATTGGTAPLTFGITSGALPSGLNLDTATGLISGTPTTAGPFSYTVTVIDTTLGIHATATTGSCGISVNPPTLTALCAPATAATVGVAYSSTIATAGGTAPLTFALANGSLPNGLTLNMSNGVISGTPTTAGPFSYTIKVTDSTPGVQGTATTSNCGINVNPRTMTAVCAPATTATVGVAYSSTIATTGGTAPLTFALASGALPNGLTFNAGTGVISGTPTTAAPFSYSVTVTDATLGVHATATTGSCGINVSAPNMTAACASTTTGQVGVGYSSPIVVTGGLTPYSFTVASGSLPAGLTLNASTGLIAGTPTLGGASAFTVSVTDSTLGVHASASTASCGISISPAPPMQPTQLTASCAPVTTGQVGTAFSSQVVASGGTAPYTFTLNSGSLPAGLSLSSTGLISGTPTSAAAYSFTVKVIDSTGGSHLTAITAGCGITIAPGPLAVACAPGTTGVTGVPYGSQVQASGGTAPYTFSLNSGALPVGLTLSSTGLISGTPIYTGASSFTVKVTDSTGGTAKTAITGSCGITVGVSTLNTCGLTWGYWKNHVSLWPITSMVLGNQSYNQTELQNILGLPVAGDASLNLAHQLIAAKFNVYNGTNPNTDSGAIAAADALLSTYSTKLPLNVDGSSAAGMQMTTIAGNLDTFNSDGIAQPGCNNGPAPLTLSCASGAGQVNVAYSSSIGVAGGMAPYSFAIISGALPAGLTLNTTTGAITGTPTTSGAYTYTVMVSDATATAGSLAGIQASKCSITITPAAQPLAVQCASGSASPGSAYVSAATASGGTGPYTYAMTGGALPTGLTLNTSTGAITGTLSAAGAYSYTIKATDSKNVYGSSSCSITVSGGIVTGTYTTYTQGGWGAPAKGNNPGALLTSKFGTVYPGGYVTVGGTNSLKFTSALAIINFLPQGGTAGKLTSTTTNSTSSSAGVFAGQVLALQLSVDFSNKGITHTGLANLTVVSGPAAGLTVGYILGLANSVLGGAAPPAGYTIADINAVVDAINNNFDNGTTNNGYLR